LRDVRVKHATAAASIEIQADQGLACGIRLAIKHKPNAGEFSGGESTANGIE
jgi:hypothetical protein